MASPPPKGRITDDPGKSIVVLGSGLPAGPGLCAPRRRPPCTGAAAPRATRRTGHPNRRGALTVTLRAHQPLTRQSVNLPHCRVYRAGWARASPPTHAGPVLRAHARQQGLRLIQDYRGHRDPRRIVRTPVPQTAASKGCGDEARWPKRTPSRSLDITVPLRTSLVGPEWGISATDLLGHQRSATRL